MVPPKETLPSGVVKHFCDVGAGPETWKSVFTKVREVEKANTQSDSENRPPFSHESHGVGEAFRVSQRSSGGAPSIRLPGSGQQSSLSSGTGARRLSYLQPSITGSTTFGGFTFQKVTPITYSRIVATAAGPDRRFSPQMVTLLLGAVLQASPPLIASLAATATSLIPPWVSWVVFTGFYEAFKGFLETKKLLKEDSDVAKIFSSFSEYIANSGAEPLEQTAEREQALVADPTLLWEPNRCFVTFTERLYVLQIGLEAKTQPVPAQYGQIYMGPALVFARSARDKRTGTHYWKQTAILENQSNFRTAITNGVVSSFEMALPKSGTFVLGTLSSSGEQVPFIKQQWHENDYPEGKGDLFFRVEPCCSLSEVFPNSLPESIDDLNMEELLQRIAANPSEILAVNFYLEKRFTDNSNKTSGSSTPKTKATPLTPPSTPSDPFDPLQRSVGWLWEAINPKWFKTRAQKSELTNNKLKFNPKLPTMGGSVFQSSSSKTVGKSWASCRLQACIKGVWGVGRKSFAIRSKLFGGSSCRFGPLGHR